MTVRITHAKVSGKAAGTDATRVYGTQWDADHNITGLDASALTVQQPGTGAVARTVTVKFGDFPSIADWSSAADAVTAVTNLGGGTVAVPGAAAPTLPATYPGILFDYSGLNLPVRMFSEVGAVDSTATRVLRSKNAKSVNGTAQNSVVIEARPVGANLNGPSQGNYALGISSIKQDWQTTTQPGEIGGLNIVIRNGGLSGGNQSDYSGILINASNVGPTGFGTGIEGLTQNVDASTFAALKQIGYQLGVIDSVSGDSNGLVLTAAVGTIATGLLIQTGSTAAITTPIKYIDSTGATKFSVNTAGDVSGTNYSMGSTPFASVSGGFTNILKPDNSGAILINNTQIAYRATSHVFQNYDATAQGAINQGIWQATLIAGQYGGTGVANTGKTLTIGGNFVTAGAASLPVIAQGDLWYGSVAGVISALAKDTGSSRFLKNSGTSNNPAWAQPAFTDISGSVAASQMPALTGDVTTSAGAVATTLATVNTNTGSWGSATQSAQFTVNGKGLITAAANVTVTPAVGNITGLGTGVATALAVNVGSAGAPVLFNGAGGTPSSITLTNASGTAASLTAGNVTTNANLTGDVTSVGNATTLTNAPVIAKVLTGYTSGSGTVSATDSILSAFQKLNGNDGLKANIASPTFTGTATSPIFNATTAASAYQISGSTVLSVSTNYTQLLDPSAGVKMFFGNAGDPTNYLRNTSTLLQTTGGVTYAGFTATAASFLGATAIPAGGTTGTGIALSSTANFGIFFGSGAPTLSAAKGSFYLRSDGSATNNRAYINTDGSTTWTALTTAA